MRKGILIVLSGPSGSGKTTLARHIVRKMNNVKFATSYTTRKKREGEIEAIDYKFVTKEKFIEMKRNGEFAEWAKVYGNFYGTPISEIDIALNEGCDVLLDIDVQGASQIKEKFEDSVHVFLVPPDMEVLRDRLNNRQTEDEIDLKKRLVTAVEEISGINNYDYIIISDDIDNSANILKSIIESVRSKTEYMIDLVFERFNLL